MKLILFVFALVSLVAGRKNVVIPEDEDDPIVEIKTVDDDQDSQENAELPSRIFGEGGIHMRRMDSPKLFQLESKTKFLPRLEPPTVRSEGLIGFPSINGDRNVKTSLIIAPQTNSKSKITLMGGGGISSRRSNEEQYRSGNLQEDNDMLYASTQYKVPSGGSVEPMDQKFSMSAQSNPYLASNDDQKSRLYKEINYKNFYLPPNYVGASSNYFSNGNQNSGTFYVQRGSNSNLRPSYLVGSSNEYSFENKNSGRLQKDSSSYLPPKYLIGSSSEYSIENQNSGRFQKERDSNSYLPPKYLVGSSSEYSVENQNSGRLQKDSSSYLFPKYLVGSSSEYSIPSQNSGRLQKEKDPGSYLPPKYLVGSSNEYSIENQNSGRFQKERDYNTYLPPKYLVGSYNEYSNGNQNSGRLQKERDSSSYVPPKYLVGSSSEYSIGNQNSGRLQTDSSFYLPPKYLVGSSTAYYNENQNSGRLQKERDYNNFESQTGAEMNARRSSGLLNIPNLSGPQITANVNPFPFSSLMGSVGMNMPPSYQNIPSQMNGYGPPQVDFGANPNLRSNLMNSRRMDLSLDPTGMVQDGGEYTVKLFDNPSDQIRSVSLDVQLGASSPVENIKMNPSLGLNLLGARRKENDLVYKSEGQMYPLTRSSENLKYRTQYYRVPTENGPHAKMNGEGNPYMFSSSQPKGQMYGSHQDDIQTNYRDVKFA